MKIDEQQKHFADFVEKQKIVLFKKGSDYAIDEDKLSNFKTVANIINLKTSQVALVMIGIKVARLGVLLSSDKEPQNESIRDSVLDLANYSILLDAILSER